MLQGLRTITKKWEGGGVGVSPPPLRAPISVTAGRAAHLPLLDNLSSTLRGPVNTTVSHVERLNPPTYRTILATVPPTGSAAHLPSWDPASTAYLPMPMPVLPMPVLPVCQGTPARERQRRPLAPLGNNPPGPSPVATPGPSTAIPSATKKL